MRKYLFSRKTLTTAFGAIGLARATAKGPRDWRTALQWVVWACAFATVVGTVKMKSDQIAEEQEREELARRPRSRRRPARPEYARIQTDR
jgi:hypothetical protein